MLAVNHLKDLKEELLARFSFDHESNHMLQILSFRVERSCDRSFEGIKRKPYVCILQGESVVGSVSHIANLEVFGLSFVVGMILELLYNYGFLLGGGSSINIGIFHVVMEVRGQELNLRQNELNCISRQGHNIAFFIAFFYAVFDP